MADRGNAFPRGGDRGRGVNQGRECRGGRWGNQGRGGGGGRGGSQGETQGRGGGGGGRGGNQGGIGNWRGQGPNRGGINRNQPGNHGGGRGNGMLRGRIPSGDWRRGGRGQGVAVRGAANMARGQGLAIRGLANRGGSIGFAAAPPVFPPSPFILLSSNVQPPQYPMLAPYNPAVLRGWSPNAFPAQTPPQAFHGIVPRLMSDPMIPYFHQFALGTDDNLDYSTTPAERAAWLASYPRWTNNIGHGFKGTKVLGMGSFGIAGLFQRIPSIGWQRANALMNVVVKQSGGSRSGLSQLRNEGMWLKLCAESGTKHIVKMYGDVHFEVGQGTMQQNVNGTSYFIDSDREQIGRMYLEFCEGGDMRRYINNMYSKYTARDPQPEELIWLAFKCLASGISVLRLGHEDPGNTANWDHNIIHLDMKPDNVLLGTSDSEHPKSPIFKISDFGMSDDAPDFPSAQATGFSSDMYRRGTNDFKGPEQYLWPAYPFDPADINTPLNVWGVGKAIYMLVMRGRNIHMSDNSFYCEFDAGVVRETYGSAICNAPYSVRLRRLVLRCIALDISARPTPRQLLLEINQALADIDAVAAAHEGGVII